VSVSVIRHYPGQGGQLVAVYIIINILPLVTFRGEIERDNFKIYNPNVHLGEYYRMR